MRRPRVYFDRQKAEWAIDFVLEGELTTWSTELWRDALTFALGLCRLQQAGLRRA